MGWKKWLDDFSLSPMFRPVFRLAVVVLLLVFVTVSTFLTVLISWFTGDFGATVLVFSALWALLIGLIWWRRRPKGLGKAPLALAAAVLLMPFVGEWVRQKLNADQMVANLFAPVPPVAMLVYPSAVYHNDNGTIRYHILRVVSEGKYTLEQKRTVYRAAMQGNDRGLDLNICLILKALGPEAAPLLPEFRRQLRNTTKEHVLAAEVLVAMGEQDPGATADLIAALPKAPPPSNMQDELLNKHFLDTLAKLGPQATKDAVPALAERFGKRGMLNPAETALLREVVKIDPAGAKPIVSYLVKRLKGPVLSQDLDLVEILAVVDPGAARNAVADLDRRVKSGQQYLADADKGRLGRMAREIGSP